MSLKCVFQFEALDSTKSLNQRAEYLFKKGIYYGGKVTKTDGGKSLVTVEPFRLISYDGMYVISDSNIIISVNEGDHYVVCKAKYIVDDSPDISVMTMEKETYEGLSEEEKEEYIKFASVYFDGTSLTITQNIVKEEISQLGRNHNRGYFDSYDELAEYSKENPPQDGDFATVKSSQSVGIAIYVYSREGWRNYGSASDVEKALRDHRANIDYSASHSTPEYDPESTSSITPQQRWEGAYHLNWNQLRSLRKFEASSNTSEIEPIITEERELTTKGYLQVVYLTYGDIATISIPTFTEVDNISSVSSASKYCLDKVNGLLYIWGNNNDTVTITYTYTYFNRCILAENEFDKLPRPNELKAFEGNEYTGLKKHSDKVPSSTNRFITENTPTPKKETISGTGYSSKYITLERNKEIYIGTKGNAQEYFEVEDDEGSSPIFIEKVLILNNGTLSTEEVKGSDTVDGWFHTTDTITLALVVKAISSFTASTITEGKTYNVSAYCKHGLGDTSIDSFVQKVHKDSFKRIGLLQVDKVFATNGTNETVIDISGVVVRSNATKLSTNLISSGLQIKYNDTTVASLYADNNNFEISSTKNTTIKTTGDSSLNIFGKNSTKITVESTSSSAYVFVSSNKTVSIQGNKVIINTESGSGNNNIELGGSNQNRTIYLRGNIIDIGNQNFDSTINIGYIGKADVNLKTKDINVTSSGKITILPNEDETTDIQIGQISDTSADVKEINNFSLYSHNTYVNSETIISIRSADIETNAYDYRAIVNNEYSLTANSLNATGTSVNINGTSMSLYTTGTNILKINNEDNQSGFVNIGNSEGIINLNAGTNLKLYCEGEGNNEYIDILSKYTGTNNIGISRIDIQSLAETNGKAISEIGSWFSTSIYSRISILSENAKTSLQLSTWRNAANTDNTIRLYDTNDDGKGISISTKDYSKETKIEIINENPNVSSRSSSSISIKSITHGWQGISSGKPGINIASCCDSPRNPDSIRIGTYYNNDTELANPISQIDLGITVNIRSTNNINISSNTGLEFLGGGLLAERGGILRITKGASSTPIISLNTLSNFISLYQNKVEIQSNDVISISSTNNTTIQSSSGKIELIARINDRQSNRIEASSTEIVITAGNHYINVKNDNTGISIGYSYGGSYRTVSCNSTYAEISSGGNSVSSSFKSQGTTATMSSTGGQGSTSRIQVSGSQIDISSTAFYTQTGVSVTDTLHFGQGTTGSFSVGSIMHYASGLYITLNGEKYYILVRKA